MQNFNVGILGHVDSGKTSIARCLSETPSTACFDKSPQSQSRGITLDLGFSCFHCDEYRVTLVDCPGHASLIRTVLCGSQIIDVVMLVVDATKGIQMQTAECLILTKLLDFPLIVILNKVDLVKDPELVNGKITKILNKLELPSFSFVSFSTVQDISNHTNTLHKVLHQHYLSRKMSESNPQFLMISDHCFAIKGKGTVLTGTILSGSISVGDIIEIGPGNGVKKIKSMQAFHRPCMSAHVGDRVGICVTNLNPEGIERSLIFKPGSISYVTRLVASVRRVRFYSRPFKNRSKAHVMILNDTSLAKVTLVVDGNLPEELTSDHNDVSLTAVLDFERPVPLVVGAQVIVLHIDLNLPCRFILHGTVQDSTDSPIYTIEKQRHFCIDRIVKPAEIIVRDISRFVNHKVELVKNGQVVANGLVTSAFGASCKARVMFKEDVFTSKVLLLDYQIRVRYTKTVKI